MVPLVGLIWNLTVALPQTPVTTAVFAGGCFWGVEAVFEHLRGVSSATSGYARGSGIAPLAGWDGRVEAVRVVFDPSQISYRELLEVFFRVAHDPTSRDRQGPDVGPEYRALVLYRNADQKRLAEAYLAQLGHPGGMTSRPIVTEVRGLAGFDLAEPFHQDYALHHSSDPYIVANDAPKLARLRKEFPKLYQESRQSPLLIDFPLKLVRLTLQADSMAGLQILAQPAAKTFEGRKAGDLIWLRFHPDSALDWLNRAAAVLRTPLGGGPADAIQWSPTLRPLDGQGGLLLGRHRKKGVLAKDYWIAIADSAPGWQAEIAAVEADSLLKLVLTLAPQARIDLALVADGERRAVGALDPAPRGPPGHAAAQFIVGVDGQIEPQSLLVLAASSPRHRALARELLLGTRFRPAERSGAVVRHLVGQVITWR